MKKAAATDNKRPSRSGLQSQESHRGGGNKTVSIAGESRPGTRERVTTADMLPSIGGASGNNRESMLEELKQNCIDYIFPPHKQLSHKALVRLSLYAKYGPAIPDLDGKLKLHGSQRLLQHHEEVLMLQEEERALTYEVYSPMTLTSKGRRENLKPDAVSAVKSVVAPNTSSRALDDDSFGEINTKKHELMVQLMELSKPELKELLDHATFPEKEKDGSEVKRTTLADAISNALLVERERRIRVLKGSDPRIEKLRTDTDVSKKKSTRFYNRTFPKAYEIRNFEDPRDILRALHRSAFMISEYSERNKPDINYNIRCLRPDFQIKPGTVKEGWDNFACTRRSHSGKATTLRK